MRLDGRRRSNNVIDKRSLSGKAVGGGIIGVIIAIAIAYFSGGDIGDVAGSALSQLGQGQQTEYVADAEDNRLEELSSRVLAGTEDVWSQVFRENGWGAYQPPKMVLYHGYVSTGCGQGSAQSGPFYCSADQTVYIDLDFFKNMETQIGSGGDFSYAYVIAHEVGHHVQYLLGTLSDAHARMSRLPESEANKISVCLELQADYYAGVWANRDNAMFGSVEPGDVENAIETARKIGDDYLQKQAYGREMPENFNHGRSAWRQRWLQLGIDSGSPTAHSPFDVPYGQF